MELAQQQNFLQLHANIESIGEERYTPAGILVTDLILQHQSKQVEFKVERQVSLLIKAIAFDDLAYRLRNIDMSAQYKFVGFLSNRGRTQQVVFHITDFQPVSNCS